MQTLTPFDALVQLARSFGAKGKALTNLTFSDEFVNAVEAVESDGQYDRKTCEVVESAYCEGRREWRLAGGWKTAWTTAPNDYDGFGTEMVEGPFEWEGKQLRRVVIDPDFFSWQTGRYGSGGHGDWDEDPRVAEARIRETLAREKFEAEVGRARYAGGILWLRDLDDATLASADNDALEDAFYTDLSARGLTWKDLRAEQRRRREENIAAERAAKWAQCRAVFKDGDTLIDAGTEGYRGYYGWVSGHESKAHFRCKVKPHYSCEDDAELAVVYEDDGSSTVGTLAAVAAMFASGRMRIAGPEDVIPPRAVTDRLRISWKDVLRVDVNGRIVWIGYQFASSEALVLDDDGRIVRAKKVVAAAHEAMSLHIASKRERRMHRMGHPDGCDCDTCKAPIVHTICHESQE